MRRFKEKFLLVLAIFSVALFLTLLADLKGFIYLGIFHDPIQALETEYDYGILTTGTTVSHTFVLKNKGYSSIKIKDIGVSCFCLTVTPSKTTFLPGETVKISCSFETHGYVGDKSQVCIIKFDPENISPIQLSLKGFLYTPEVYLSKSEVDFGDVCIGETSNSKIKVLNADYPNDIWSIDEIKSTNDMVRVSFNQEMGEILCQLDTQEEVKTINGDIIVLVNSPKGGQKIQIPIKGNIVEYFTVSPKALFLGNVEAGAIVKKELKIISSGKLLLQDLEIDMEIPNNGCWNLLNHGQHVIAVGINFKTPNEAGVYNYNVIIRNKLDNATISVPISFNVVENDSLQNNDKNGDGK